MTNPTIVGDLATTLALRTEVQAMGYLPDGSAATDRMTNAVAKIRSLATGFQVEPASLRESLLAQQKQLGQQFAEIFGGASHLDGRSQTSGIQRVREGN